MNNLKPPKIPAWRRSVAVVFWAVYSIFVASILLFLAVEIRPQLLQFINVDGVQYYAMMSRYVADERLVFTRRPISKISSRLYGGDEFDSLPREDAVRQWLYEDSFNDYGFRTNRSAPPFSVLFLGDSFVEFGESDHSTLSEEFATQTKLSTFNAGLAFYGPPQYLELYRRFVKLLNPSIVVIGVFSGNDARDMHSYNEWLTTGQYYHFGDQNRGIVFRYLAAMRDVLKFISRKVGTLIEAKATENLTQIDVVQQTIDQPNKSDSSGPSGNSPPFPVWGPQNGTVRVGAEDLPMVFSYWNPPYRSEELLATPEWEALQNVVAEIEQDKRKSKVRVIWLLIPTKLEVYGRQAQWPMTSDTAFRRSLETQLMFEDNFSGAFRKIADDFKLEYVDLLPEFRKLAANCVLYYPTDSHWNAYARRLAAKLLADKLVRGDTVPTLGEKVGENFCGKSSEFFGRSFEVSQESLDPAHLLANQSISDEQALGAAAAQLGLRPSRYMHGYVDWLERIPDGSVKLGGWAVDTNGDGSPLSLVIFAQGKGLPVVPTIGERPDVKDAYRLADRQSENLAFVVVSPSSIACGPTDNFVVVAVNNKKEYARIPFWKSANPECKPTG